MAAHVTSGVIRGGIGRESTPAAEALSDYLRRGGGDLLARRPRTAALSLGGAAALGIVALYQFSIIKRLPDPPLPLFASDEVDAAGEAYTFLATPDAALGMTSYALTVVLAGMGGEDRARARPWIPLALAGKVFVDALGGLYLAVEQASRHRKFCFYCLLAAAASIASVRDVLPEARLALAELKRPR